MKQETKIKLKLIFQALRGLEIQKVTIKLPPFEHEVYYYKCIDVDKVVHAGSEFLKRDDPDLEV